MEPALAAGCGGESSHSSTGKPTNSESSKSFVLLSCRAKNGAFQRLPRVLLLGLRHFLMLHYVSAKSCF